MIVNLDINPEMNIYFLGAKALEVLRQRKFEIVNLIDLVDGLSDSLGKKVSIDSVLFTLDWLFLLGLVESTPKGEIKPCF